MKPTLRLRFPAFLPQNQDPPWDPCMVYLLVGGFNPIEKYQSNWIISPGRGENKKCVKPPPSLPLQTSAKVGKYITLVLQINTL